MKDGIQNMFDAYKKSPGNQNKNLANIKIGWKDCIHVSINDAFRSRSIGTLCYKTQFNLKI